MRKLLASATVWLAAVGTMMLPAAAQPQYPPYPYGWGRAAAPPSWSYDPYTSGLSPCPQRLPSDPPCGELMPPSYGQPNYRPQMP